MIYTCTLNPAIDVYVSVEDFSSGKINLGQLKSYQAGGKGVNVAKILNKEGIPNISLGFYGGLFGDLFIKLLNQSGVRHDFVRISDETRLNIKIRSTQETDINMTGSIVTTEELNCLLDKINKLTELDYLVLAGRAVKNADNLNVVGRIGEAASNKKFRLIADMSGADLEEVIKYQPFLIKPNLDELESLVNKSLSDLSSIEQVAKELINKYNIQYVLVSLAQSGALLVSQDRVYYEKAPLGTVVNTTGAGDALLGSFLSNYIKTDDIAASLRKGVECASNVVFTGRI